ncbi:dihydrolipoamide acetyltransferase family protein [Pseudoflavonifractor sp. MSJ-37]|uniref:dihydrolipoamide acetyltransferase family protein n=1 Tax=Pseudoflavonifractor sp. MSJ-37 TaxID=2841531 RepID=UPI001C109B31|nr:dihydrolipoamide acetyltransferase family protein [Pseudoflavonifractor sp. MSJ-37]MBU5434142.1 2-oxo acid dehydrogenase subunit E2 [Pseudoflavonifractor sp. MSJ-37]
MITNYGMPKFGLSMETGIISEWLVKEGDAVKKGDALVEISTDKITNTGEAPCDGVIRQIVAQVDDEIPCGETICIIADSMDEPVGGAAPVAAPAAEAAESAPAAVPAAPAAAAPADVKITPRAKKIAEEKGLAYAHIKGTGLLGMITIDDLKKYGKPISEVAAPAAPAAAPVPAAPAAPAAPAPAVAAAPASAQVYNTAPCAEGDVITKMTPMQMAVCKGMMNSLQGSAQITIATEADVTELVKVYKSIKGKYKNAGVKLSYTAMLIKSVAQALEDHPAMRMTVADANHIKTTARISIGCAVDIPDGLIVPVIRDANLKDLRTICLELADLTERAKAGKLNSDELGNASITITNLGMFGITYFTPIINAPEGSILGVGAILEKMMVKDGGFYPGSVMNLSLTHDHRVINGAPAARFLQEVINGLQDFKWL